MAFDVTYAAFNFAPSSGLTWGEAFIWLNAHVNGGATEVSVTNSDGSVTLFTGTGLTLDASGLPTAGDVTQIQRVSADGSTLYEQYDFSSSPQLAYFYTQGIGDWFLSGNDGIFGGALDDALIGGAGEDQLTGGQHDVMIGGANNDHYVISNTGQY
jgi:Ca2+-binding RTX toxin-like protein